MDTQQRSLVVEQVVQAVIAAAQMQQCEGDFLAQVVAVAKALSRAGIPSKPVAGDMYFLDSDVDGMRAYAFLLGKKPCSMQGASGWNDILDQLVELFPENRERDWTICENFDMHSLVEGDIAVRAPGFDDLVDRLAAPAIAKVDAHALDTSTPQSGFRRPRTSL